MHGFYQSWIGRLLLLCCQLYMLVLQNVAYKCLKVESDLRTPSFRFCCSILSKLCWFINCIITLSENVLLFCWGILEFKPRNLSLQLLYVLGSKEISLLWLRRIQTSRFLTLPLMLYCQSCRPYCQNHLSLKIMFYTCNKFS